MRRTRLVAAAVITLLSLVGGAGPVAADEIDDAAEALRSDPVYNDPDAERSLTESQVGELRRAIRAGDDAIYVAILPEDAIDDAGGDSNDLPIAVGEATGLRGTYAVLAGDSFRAASNALEKGVAADIATDSFNDRKSDGPFAVLLEFVERIQQADADVDTEDGGTSSATDSAGDGEASNSRGGGGAIVLLVVLGVIGGIVFLVIRAGKKGKAKHHQVLIGEREDLRAQLSVLASDVLRLQPEVDIHPEARSDYEAAVARFKWLGAAIDAIDSDDDIPRLRRALAEARYAMDRAEAVVRGQSPPSPPPDLQAEGPKGEPAVAVDDDGAPVYAGRGRGSWDGGGFFGGNGMLTGILVGSMLGGGGGAGGHHDSGAYDRGYEAGRDDSHDNDRGDDNDNDRSNESDFAFRGNDNDRDSGSFDFGDSGGGDFGGGDVGGGDFG